MKRFVLAIAVTLPLICSAEQTAPNKKTTAASAKAATGKKAAPPVAVKQLTIPADAVQTGENTYTKTDGQGKKWIYYQTPFGITRAEEPTSAQKQAAATLPAISDYSAAEQGDSIRFTKATPFGPLTWTRGKSELTADERATWERQKQAPAKRDQ